MSENFHETPTDPMDKRRRRVRLLDVGITLGVILVVVVVFLVFNRGGDAEEGLFSKFNPFTGSIPTGPAPEIGKPAPDFTVNLLDGSVFRLSEQKGKVVWLNFWATWCPPCRAEMPDIQEVWEEEQGSDLVLVAVDYAESTQTVTEFVEKLGLTFPIGMDSTGQITTNYRVSGFPSHFMIDRNGILREIRVGLMNQATMRAKLEGLKQY